MNKETETQIALLALQAQFLTDLEKLRIGNGNRIWALTNRFGLTEEDGETVRSANVLDEGLTDLEKRAEKDLVAALKQTEFYPIIGGMLGVGFKQGARLLGVIGHPCYRWDREAEVWLPRQLSHLYSYCGYAPVEVQTAFENQRLLDRTASETRQTPVIRVAAKRKRGEQANYNTDARMRCYLIAASCIKQLHSPYRKVYDIGRAKYAESTHDVECLRCGPKGKPAKVGSPLSDGHKHARALRLVAKRVLEDFWLAAGGEEICGTLPYGHPGEPHRIRQRQRLAEQKKAA